MANEPDQEDTQRSLRLGITIDSHLYSNSSPISLYLDLSESEVGKLVHETVE